MCVRVCEASRSLSQHQCEGDGVAFFVRREPSRVPACVKVSNESDPERSWKGEKGEGVPY